MKVYFINPPFKAEYGKFARENRSPAITRSGCLYYPLWLIYSAAVCENDGFEVKFLDAPATPLNEAQSLEVIKKHGEGTKLFVLETSTPSVESDINFAGRLKDAYPDAFVLIVGTHVSVLPNETLALSEKVDAVARHEFDYTVRDVAEAIKHGKTLSDVEGITWRKDGEFVTNPNRAYIENLDAIPWAAPYIKKWLNYKDYFFPAATYPEVQIFTGRGCKYRCNYCLYPHTLHGHVYRHRSEENILGELSYIAENFPDVKEIVFEDDNFTSDKVFIKKLCEGMIDKGLNNRFKWVCNARVNLDLDTMKLMKAAGCRLTTTGFESGSQEILNNIKKGSTEEQGLKFAKNMKAAGLLVHGTFMVGNKGETKETMQQTLDFALKLNPDTAQFYPLLPFPGTGAYVWAKENGYITGNYSDFLKEDGTINATLNLPNLSAAEMVEFCDEARRKFFYRPSYIMHRIFMGLRYPGDLKRSWKAYKSIRKYLKK